MGLVMAMSTLPPRLQIMALGGALDDSHLFAHVDCVEWAAMDRNVPIVAISVQFYLTVT